MFFRRRRSEFRGHLDGVHQGFVHGWVQDRQYPKLKQMVEIYHAGSLIGSVRAQDDRQDLKEAGIGDGQFGFRFELPKNMLSIESLAAKVKDQNYWLINNIPAQIFPNINEKLINSPRYGLPLLQPGLSLYTLGIEDIELAEKIIQFWREIRSQLEDDHSSNPKSMWSYIFANQYKTLVSLLNQGDAETLAKYLITIHQHPESTGLYQGERAYKDFIDTTPGGRYRAVLFFHDMLASLSQYLAIDNLECRELGADGAILATSSEIIVTKIEEGLGFKITLKNLYDGIFGLKINKNILHGRDIQALYLALRASEILSGSQKSVCEIGAGFGLSAYYALKAGCSKYIIVDLPLVCILQYFTLKRLLPNQRIEILKRGQSLPAEDGIYIITAQDAFDITNLSADLVVNVDSFPEMGDKLCKDYLTIIPRWAPLLLSINQESNREIEDKNNLQIVVSSLLSAAGFKRQYRFRSWINQGYAEELWASPSSPTSSPVPGDIQP